jgi:hypothetical protein
MAAQAQVTSSGVVAHAPGYRQADACVRTPALALPPHRRRPLDDCVSLARSGADSGAGYLVADRQGAVEATRCRRQVQRMVAFAVA